jgi:OmpA-OmpF porin, OOP family
MRVGTLVSNRLGGELGGSVVVLDWLQVAADLPLIFDQSRSQMQSGVNGMLSDIGGVGLGDLRISPKVRLLRKGMLPMDLALTAEITVPTASAENYRGETGLTAYPFVSASSQLGRFRWGVNLGYLARKPKSVADLKIDDELRGRAGLSYGITSALELGINGSIATAANGPFKTFGRNYSEVLAGPTYTMDSKWVLFAAAGAGLQSGYGSPDWRALAGLRIGTFTSQDSERDSDRDRDGIVGVADLCPTQAEDADGFQDQDGCPDADNDGDGIADADDKCADQAESANALVKDGCPDITAETEKAAVVPAVADADSDGVVDSEDKCPNDAEDKDSVADSDGCPEDNDADGVADADDKCNMQAGVAENSGCPDVDTDGDAIVDRLDTCPNEKGQAKFNGCARKGGTAITAGGIQLVDVVYFQTDKAVILARSYKLLDTVAEVIASHPDMPAVTIEGHTDDRGDAAYNTDLSQRRAEAVMAYLVAKGISSSRLTARGFGPSVPIASNKTNKGRSTNRRVEFKIAGVGSLRTGPEGTLDKSK